MTDRSQPESPLDGLITCGTCAQPMLLDHAGEDRFPRYVCRSATGGRNWCGAPPLDAGRADALIIRQVLRAILTEENITVVLVGANGPLGEDEKGEHALTRREVEALKDSPEDFVRSVGGAAAARAFLAGFISQIRARLGAAVIHYSMPLPPGSPLAGALRHEVPPAGGRAGLSAGTPARVGP